MAAIRKRRRNLSALGWTGVVLGTAAAVVVIGSGVVLYRMMKM
jgi:hypothetical protein